MPDTGATVTLKADHTPTPWQYFAEPEPHVRSRTGLSTVAIINTSDSAEAKANAQYIVRAANHFDSLLRSLGHALHTKHDIRTCACAECEDARRIHWELVQQ